MKYEEVVYIKNIFDPTVDRIVRLELNEDTGEITVLENGEVKFVLSEDELKAIVNLLGD